jgi:hypothetical protein
MKYALVAALLAVSVNVSAESYTFIKGGVYDQVADNKSVYIEPIGEVQAGIHVDGWELSFMHRSQIGHKDDLKIYDETRPNGYRMMNNVENSIGVSYTIKFGTSGLYE